MKKYQAAGPSRDNIKQLKKLCETIYFQIKNAKEKNENENFDGFLNNLEFKCLDGTVGKLEEMNRNFGNNPKIIYYNAKYNFIQGLATQFIQDGLDNYNRSEEYHIHDVAELISLVEKEYKTYPDNPNDIYTRKTVHKVINSDIHISSEDYLKRQERFLSYVKENEKNFITSERISDNLLNKLPDVEILKGKFDFNPNLSEDDRIESANSIKLRINAVNEALKPLLQKEVEQNDRIIQYAKAALLDIKIIEKTEDEYGMELITKIEIKGYKPNYQEILKCIIAQNLAELGYIDRVVKTCKDCQIIILDNALYKFDEETHDYSMYINLKQVQNLTIDGKSIQVFITDELDSNVNISIDNAIKNIVDHQFSQYVETEPPYKMFFLVSDQAKIIYRANTTIKNISDLYDTDKDKFNALTSDKALECYTANAQFNQLENLYDTNKDKFNALTSDKALKCYTANAQFNQLENLYDTNKDKFNALTSDKALECYKIGITFTNLSLINKNLLDFLLSSRAKYYYQTKTEFEKLQDLYDRDKDKFNALTSDKASECCSRGIPFSQLNAAYDKSPDVFNFLTSDNCMNIYRSNTSYPSCLHYNATTFNRFFESYDRYQVCIGAGADINKLTKMYDCDKDKYTALTSDSAIKCYEAGITFDELNTFEAKSLKAITDIALELVKNEERNINTEQNMQQRLQENKSKEIVKKSMQTVVDNCKDPNQFACACFSIMKIRNKNLFRNWNTEKQITKVNRWNDTTCTNK